MYEGLNSKFYKVINGTFHKVNEWDYTIKYYCGYIHWINNKTGNEEEIYINREKMEKDIMDIETKIVVTNKVTDDVEWRDFTFNISNINGYYSSTNGNTCTVLIDGGECEILMSYKHLKSQIELFKNKKSTFQFN